MAAGLTSIHFNDGPSDGIVIQDVPAFRLRDILNRMGPIFMCLDRDGSRIFTVRVEPGSAPPAGWFSGRRSAYRKRGTGDAGVQYDFEHSRIVGRCMALNEDGSWCGMVAEPGSVCCERSHFAHDRTQRMIRHPLVAEELRDIADECAALAGTA